MISVEKILLLLFLVGLSGYLWLMVLSPYWRGKFGQPGFLALSDQKNREGLDPILFMVYLVTAVLFSLVTLVFLFIGLYR